MFKEFSPDLDICFYCTVIRFVTVNAKLGTCTVVSVNGTLVEAKMCTFTLEPTHFIFNKCSIYTQDGASSKFCTTVRVIETNRIIACAPLKNN
jgi:hypothetical protein